MDLEGKEIVSVALAGHNIQEVLKDLLAKTAAYFTYGLQVDFEKLSDDQKHTIAFAAIEMVGNALDSKRDKIIEKLPNIEALKSELFVAFEFDPKKIVEQIKSQQPERFEETLNRPQSCRRLLAF